MKHGIRRATHGNVERHGIEESLTGSNVARQHALVAILIISEGIFHYLAGSLAEQFYTIGMCSQNGAIAGKRESDSLCQRVHGVGGKHTRAAATARTRTRLNLLHLLVGHRGVGTFYHSRNQVGILATPAASLHRTTRTEDGRNVQPHGGHQHTRRHLVTIGDANHGICLVGIDHILNGVGNDVTRGKRVQHTIVPHGNTIVNSYGVELGGIASHFLYFLTYYLTNLMQVGMTRNKLSKRVDNGNDRLAKLLLFHTCSHPQSAGSGHSSTFSAYSTTQWILHFFV